MFFFHILSMLSHPFSLSHFNARHTLLSLIMVALTEVALIFDCIDLREAPTKNHFAGLQNLLLKRLRGITWI